MDRLPIDAHVAEISARLAEARRLVLVAEPGAGKTTRVPPALVDAGVAGAGQVLVLQPRRAAARAAAARISAERGTELGGFAGYQVRQDSRVSRATRVRVVTEGVLTRLLLERPELPGIGAVVLDEFHERSLHVDLALALLREVREALRPDLAVLVMSATLEAEPIASFLGDAPVIAVAGRPFPVETAYVDAERELARQGSRRTPSLAEQAAYGVRRAVSHGGGDVLAFLPGVGEIRAAADMLSDLRPAIEVLALHGELPLDEQERAIRGGTTRRVILATNVAETSLTVPGVTDVVDTGFARVLVFDPGSGLDRLELQRISRAAADQRAGRAGRTGPGRAWRLWSRADETLMRARAVPEIRRVDPAQALLALAAWGVRDPARFRWFEPPEPAALESARTQLTALGALDRRTRELTRVGRAMAELPAAPRLARMLVEAHARGALERGAELAALLSEPDLLRRSRDARLPPGPSDLLARLDLLHRGGGDHRGAEQTGGPSLDRDRARRVLRTAEALERETERALGRARRTRASDDDLLRVVLAGFPDRVARRSARGQPEAVMAGGRGVQLAPESAVRDAELFAVVDADLGQRGALRATVRVASAVDPAWLEELDPQGFAQERAVSFDEARGRAVCRQRTTWNGLVLSESDSGAVEPSEASRALREHLREHPEALGALGGDTARLLARIGSLRAWMPELELPELDSARILVAMEPWLDRCTSLEDVRRLDGSEVALSALGREQRLALERHAPETIAIPTGRAARLDYEAGKPPVLAVKLQELFGLADTPRVAGGRVAVLLHLLAPNQRVVQVTQDLASFWRNTYPQVRKDLRGRYPKHEWPEDPWTARPTARPKRRSR